VGLDDGGGGGGGESGAGHSPHVGDALADVLEVGALGDLLDDLVEALVREAPIAPCRAEVQDVDRDVLGFQWDLSLVASPIFAWYSGTCNGVCNGA